MAGAEEMIMNTTKIRTVFFVAAIFVFAVIAPVSADWDEGDSYKMYQPQLPDPNGVDVANYNVELVPSPSLLLADDWLCTETGYVTDIHIWGSWKGDRKGEIVSFNVSIWSNDLGTNFSHPSECLWQHTFNQSEFNESYWGNGTQGWVYFSQHSTGFVSGHYLVDHNDTWQYNLHIDDPTIAFKQQEGTTYWLAIAPQVNSSEYKFGWKTSQDAWEDDFVAEALWEGPHPQIEEMWYYWVRTPGYSLYSLAFVIDGPSLPEVPLLTPTGLIALVSALSAIAAVAIVRKRR